VRLTLQTFTLLGCYQICQFFDLMSLILVLLLKESLKFVRALVFE